MGTVGTILVVLGAWLVGSVLLGVLVGRMLRFGRLRPRPRPDSRPDDAKQSPADHDPARVDPLPPPRDGC